MKTCLPAEPATSIRLSEPADLLSALPFLVGFFPRDSLVVVCLIGPRARIGMALRADLPPPGHTGELARSLVGPVLARRPAGVVLVVVGGGRPHPVFGLPGSAAVTTVSATLAAHGVPTVQSLWADSLRRDARWSCLQRCCSGRLPDPGTSPIAAATTAAGQVTFADRDELRELVKPDDETVLAHRGELLDAAMAELDLAVAEDPVGVLQRGLGLVRDAVEAAGRGELPRTDEHIVALTLALADRPVRDWCLGVSATETGDDRRAAVERLWFALTRATPAPEVANVATLAAFTAYLRGNGVLAGMALDRALQAWPGHDLAMLLMTALETGMPPDVLARVADDIATDAVADALIDAAQTLADDLPGGAR